MKYKYVIPGLLALLFCLFLTSCDQVPAPPPSSDTVQQQQQERQLMEGTMKVPMPGIVNFFERKQLKMIYELRDQEGLTTYAYLENMIPTVVKGRTALGGKLTYLGPTIGFGIPYATQYTNPQKIEPGRIPVFRDGTGALYNGEYVLPQADPNGLFSPSSAAGTWLLMKDPHGNRVVPIYVEPYVLVSPFPFDLD